MRNDRNQISVVVCTDLFIVLFKFFAMFMVLSGIVFRYSRLINGR